MSLLAVKVLFVIFTSEVLIQGIWMHLLMSYYQTKWCCQQASSKHTQTLCTAATNNHTSNRWLKCFHAWVMKMHFLRSTRCVNFLKSCCCFDYQDLVLITKSYVSELCECMHFFAQALARFFLFENCWVFWAGIPSHWGLFCPYCDILYYLYHH